MKSEILTSVLKESGTLSHFLEWELSLCVKEEVIDFPALTGELTDAQSEYRVFRETGLKR